jgi:lysozyme
MELSDNGKAFIQGFEKLALSAYPDQGGVWTAGWGHTGPDVGPTTVCTIAQADTWFDEDTQATVDELNQTVTAPLTQNQFDALVSFGFNVGDEAEAKSTLIKYVNAGDYTDADAQFVRWDHVGKNVSAGLLKRRQAEAALFNNNSSSSA